MFIVAISPAITKKKQDHFYSDLKRLHTPINLFFTFENPPHPPTPPCNFPKPVLVSPLFDRVMSQNKITSSPPRFPGRWSASDVDNSISKKWKSRSQTIRRCPITPGPRLQLATLSSGPHLMDHNIILHHVPALYTCSKHKSVARAQ